MKKLIKLYRFLRYGALSLHTFGYTTEVRDTEGRIMGEYVEFVGWDNRYPIQDNNFVRKD